ncbi:MAG: Fic family protein [Bacteroidetes bacterium]|nr:Fic family protein [Bacteroidota bacterium]
MKAQQSFDRNIPFNQLPLLPPDYDLNDKDVLLKWGYASRNLAELRRNVLRLPNPNMLVNTIALQEAKSSSEIENIFTTNDELYRAISDTTNENFANPETKEVLRYREALWSGYISMTESGEFGLESIIKIYRNIKNTRQGIRSPQSEIVIRKGQSELNPGEIVYTPPRGKGIIEEKLENLFNYIKNNGKFPTDPIIKMAVAHYQFEAIHPFTDGNGRVGRIMNILYLVNQGLLTHPVLYLSKYIIENKNDYYYCLGTVTQRQDWKNWLLYMLKAVEQTAKRTNILIDAILDQMKSTLEYGRKELKWYSKEINEALFFQPYIKPKTIGEVIGRTSRTTLTKYMADLTDKGILTPKQEGKEVFYINHDLINILENS